MKFLHLGDLHLGKSLGDYDLNEDQEYILKHILEIIKTNRVDAVLIAGDVYDRTIPSEAAVKLLDDFLMELVKLNVYVFMCSGNHDSDERLNFGSRLFASNKVFISAKFDGALFKQTIQDEQGDLNVYLLPFVKASQVRHFYPEREKEIETYEDAVRVIIEEAHIDPKERNILVAHQFVTGGNVSETGEGDPALAGSEGASVKVVGTVEKISYKCFNDFAYVALGHIHSPQGVGREVVRYSGSPLKYSLSEVNNKKSAPVVELNAQGEANIELIPLKPLRDLRHIKGTKDELLKKENIQDPDDYIYVTLTDEEYVDDAMGLFRQTYPNVVHLDYHNSHTREIDQIDLSKIGEKKSFDELIREFYHMMYGCEISEEEMAIMKEVAEEAGVNETN